MAVTLHIRGTSEEPPIRATLLADRAPAITGLVSEWLRRPRRTASVHAMWTGPEISSAIDVAELAPDVRAATPPVQNGSLNPLAGEIAFLHIPSRLWDGAVDPVFDLGLFYGDRARLFFPVGWLPGSVFARVVPEDLPALAHLGRRVRDTGRTTLAWALGT